MGGAAGHMMHLYENDRLTFAELKDVLSQAAEGKLTRVSEKLDGMNLMFTYDPRLGLRVARNTSDLKTGGMSRPELASKFAGRGNVEDAFNTGFQVLLAAMDAVSSDKRDAVFKGGRRWYSLELIYSGLPNTINYDKDHIVFHGWPIYDANGGTITQVQNDESGIEELKRNINAMQNAVANRNWHVSGPALVRLKKLGDGSTLSKALAEIDIAKTTAGLSDENTIQDYVYNMAFDAVRQLNPQAPVDFAHIVAGRLAKKPGSANLNAIKKLAPVNMLDAVTELVRGEKELKKEWMRPIEMAIHDFSIEVLRGLHSSLIDDSEGEIERLRAVLKQAIQAIQSSGHGESMEVLSTQMQKLQSVENIASPMEGIVFIYKGQAYKFTGAFAPAHQIISLFSYGKGGVTFKPESTMGGKAFERVGPITAEEFKPTMEQLREDLDVLDAFNITPIGTSGKKRVMNDIDVTCEYNGDVSEFYERANDMFGESNVRRIGHNISIRYPIFDEEGPSERHVQVDVMPGDANFITWSRYAPSPELEHAEYSPVKGVLRNLLLNQVLRVMSEHTMNETTALDRKRYALDFDRGLYIITQTKRGKRKALKNWKTLYRNFVSSDPDEIVEVVFGEGVESRRMLRFEQVLHTLLTSEKTKHISARVVENFIEEVEKFASTHPKFFNGEPYETIDYIRSLIS